MKSLKIAKGVIRIRKSTKDRPNNAQKKKGERRNIDIHRKLKMEQHEPDYKP
jgi:hypothetical protein